jgi:hypothetical protein
MEIMPRFKIQYPMKNRVQDVKFLANLQVFLGFYQNFFKSAFWLSLNPGGYQWKCSMDL